METIFQIYENLLSVGTLHPLGTKTTYREKTVFLFVFFGVYSARQAVDFRPDTLTSSGRKPEFQRKIVYFSVIWAVFRKILENVRTVSGGNRHSASF